MHPGRSTALPTLLVVPALAVLTPGTDGPLAPLLATVAAVAWAASAWLLVVLALTSCSRVPGALGRAAAHAVRWVTPRSVRALVATAVGGSLLLTGPAALAEDRTPTVAGSSHDSLDWPGLAPLTARPTASAGTATTPSPGPSPSHRAPAAPAAVPTAAPEKDPPPVAVGGPHVVSGSVVVVPGDSLWSLAKRSLGAGATDRQVAQAWPRWWAANRALIGDAPDLIHPGDRLTAP